MKIYKRISVFILALMMLCFIACTNTTLPPEGTTPPKEPTPPEEPTFENTVVPTKPESGDTVYNIVFALATIPPVLAALDCIGSGHATYAIIERGKTYSGIDSLEYFHNVGFDSANNLSTGFTDKEFNDMVEKVKELNGENVFFNFYVQDGTALTSAAIAANAQLDAENFHVYMCEDGTGAYNALRNTYVKNKVVSLDKDEVYSTYSENAISAKTEFEAIMAKTDNKNNDSVLSYNIAKAFALASLPNFTYYMQDESIVIGILEDTGDFKTNLLSSFGVDGYDAKVELYLNLKYQKISDGIKKLSEKERTDYLTLMYGQYYADTYTALTRSKRADKNAPTDKLVFIGSRHGGYPHFASDTTFGIGGISDSVPKSYAELDAKYKTTLLFATETDYTTFLDVLENSDNYIAEVTDEVKTMAQVACFNIYIDYIFNLKLTYLLYGEDYDIIMKGHPREVIGAYDEWGNRYKVTYTDGSGTEANYVYDKLLDKALLAFHHGDSIGKYIGMVPYGTAAENLAYLGADIAIAGLPSSTYNGYDTDVDVLFILGETNEAIDGNYSQVKERYEAKNLTYFDSDGAEQTTLYYNIGNIYLALIDIYTELGDTATAQKYTALFDTWLDSVHGDTAQTINAQGFPMFVKE